MTARRPTTLLYLTAAALGAATVGFVWGAFTLSLDLGSPLPPASASTTPSRPATAATLPTLAELEAVATVPLRRPLRDLPPQVVDSPPPSLPPLLRLTGTILEPGPPPRSLAIFASGLTETHLVPIGGTIAGAELLAIHPGGDAVTLRFEGRTVELSLHKPIPLDDSGLDPAPPAPAAATTTPPK